LEAPGYLPIRPFLDQAQNEQFALRVREVRDLSKDSRGKRQAVVDGLEVGVRDCDREAEALPSAGLDASLAQG